MPAPLLYKMFKTKTNYPLHTAIRAKREDVVFLYLMEYDSQVEMASIYRLYKHNYIEQLHLKFRDGGRLVNKQWESRSNLFMEPTSTKQWG